MVKFKDLDFKIGGFVLGYHIVALVAIPWYLITNTPSAGLIAWSVALCVLGGLAITAGYHRLFAHRSYTAHPVVQAVLIFFGTMAIEGSVIKWSHDHRIHHRFVDKDPDPYNIHRGFFFAHMGWLFLKQKPVDMSVVSDLAKNKLVMFQFNHYGKLMFGINIFLTFVVAFFTNDLFGAFALAWMARSLAIHHATWFINSLAHTIGEKTYARELSAVDNYLLALVTFGEGYHNYHHAFASDYRNGIRWYHFDPTKWLIWSLEKVGLVTNIKRMNPFVTKKKIILEDKKLLLEHLQACVSEKRHQMEAKVAELSEQIFEKLSGLKATVQQIREDRAQKIKQKELRKQRQQVKQLSKSLRSDWHSWNKLSLEVFKVA